MLRRDLAVVCAGAAIVTVFLWWQRSADSTAPEPPSADAVGDFMFRHFRAGLSNADCAVAQEPEPDDLVTVLVPVTARTCLDCEDLGWLLRRFIITGSARPVLVATTKDAPTVCAFLRTQRAPVRVAVLSSVSPPPWWEYLQGLVLTEVLPNGERGRVVAVPSGVDAWALWHGP